MHSLRLYFTQTSVQSQMLSMECFSRLWKGNIETAPTHIQERGGKILLMVQQGGAEGL